MGGAHTNLSWNLIICFTRWECLTFCSAINFYDTQNNANFNSSSELKIKKTFSGYFDPKFMLTTFISSLFAQLNH